MAPDESIYCAPQGCYCWGVREPHKCQFGVHHATMAYSGPYSLSRSAFSKYQPLQNWTSNTMSFAYLATLRSASSHSTGREKPSDQVVTVRNTSQTFCLLRIWSLVNYKYDTSLRLLARTQTHWTKPLPIRLCLSELLMHWGCLRKLCREAGTGHTICCFHRNA